MFLTVAFHPHRLAIWISVPNSVKCSVGCEWIVNRPEWPHTRQFTMKCSFGRFDDGCAFWQEITNEGPFQWKRSTFYCRWQALSWFREGPGWSSESPSWQETVDSALERYFSRLSQWYFQVDGIIPSSIHFIIAVLPARLHPTQHTLRWQVASEAASLRRSICFQIVYEFFMGFLSSWNDTRHTRFTVMLFVGCFDDEKWHPADAADASKLSSSSSPPSPSTMSNLWK